MPLLPYTLDLNPLVSYDPQKGFQQDQEMDVRWLNAKQPHEGHYHFMIGQYEFFQNTYSIQAMKVPASRFDKISDVFVKAFDDANPAPAEDRDDLIDKLFDIGASTNDFKKDNFWVPGQVNICFHKNEKLGMNPYIRILNYDNGQQAISKEFPTEAKFTMGGDLVEATYLYNGNPDLYSALKLEFHENSNLKSLTQDNPTRESSVLHTALFDHTGKMTQLSTNKVDFSDEDWGEKLQEAVWLESLQIKAQAKNLWAGYKTKFDHAF